ncbi:coiled-coil domain-containing protein [Luteibaculum oceani]|uniref:Uncharacterized protein n=1 Tax=Luteibaculum oceani TaxID=1294296 RepID=A0A5C6V2T2_9FLAO|nr:hypothetical protein [Luteibaculum oceani]TXC78981.1 hypothetical protein FRX97_07135 [Luteibaculum oceani]
MDKKGGNFNWKELPSREKLYLGIIAFLVIACGALSWMMFENRSTIEQINLYNENLAQDKNALNDELNEMLAQYNELETDNTELQEEIITQKEKIEELQDEIAKNKGNIALIRKYKREVTTLRTIMKGYVVTIDSLNTLNKTLITENTNIKQQLSSTQQEYNRLNSTAQELKGKVKKASILQTFNVLFEGIRLRNSGKQSETGRARRIEILKVCFTLGENITTAPGKKKIYIAVENSEGQVILPKQNGQDPDAPPVYTEMREVEYENEQMDVCIYANLNGEELPEGDYLVKIFEAGEQIGSARESFK